MHSKEQSQHFMRRALELARQAWGQTHPNPMVGAVIVEQENVVAEGWHRAAGKPHAEVEALQALGRKPNKNAIMYVTLEPCSTQGRTGACTTAILESGIRTLVVGAIDPNPNHAGRGIERLRADGIHVTTGICEADCCDLNLIFNHWIAGQQPLIALKMALTLDGKFAAASGHSKWVTGDPARADVMQWRRYFPAIAVGANTVLNDDPSLTSRIGDSVWCPIRFVVDRTLKTVGTVPLPKLYTDAYKARTIVLCSETSAVDSRNTLEQLGVGVWQLPEVDGHIDLIAFRKRCARENIYGVYFEAGPTMASALLEQQLADYAFVYQAPKLMNDSAAPGIGYPRSTELITEALQLKDVRHAILGEDVLTRGRIGTSNFE